QFAFPENIWVRVRAWSVRAWAPASRQRSAMATGSRWASSHPLRIFTVTGRCVALRTAAMIRCTRPRSLRQPEPPLFLTTFLTGQPKLMARNVMTRCARSNHSLRFAAVQALETARALARVFFRRRDQPAAAKQRQRRCPEGAGRSPQPRRQGRADAREDAEAARDARLDRDRPQYRDSPLPRPRGEPAARRLRPQARGSRLQRDRRQARPLLLSDRGPTARSVQPVPAGARQDRPVCEGGGCAR